MTSRNAEKYVRQDMNATHLNMDMDMNMNVTIEALLLQNCFPLLLSMFCMSWSS